MFLSPLIKRAIELVKIHIKTQEITVHYICWRNAIGFFWTFFTSKTRSERAQLYHESLQLVLGSIINLFFFSLQQIKSFFRLVSRYLSNQLCPPSQHTPPPRSSQTLLLNESGQVFGCSHSLFPIIPLNFMLLKIHPQP